jgi:VWFA-related protein
VLLAQVQTAPVQPPSLLYNQRRLLVLYFDLRAMPVIERERAFASAQSFVRTKMQSGDVVAIMTAGDDVKIRQDFTGDSDRLLQTLDQLATDAGQEQDGTVDADRQLAGLQTAVNMLESLKQKKALIYFSIPSAGTATVGTLRSLIDSAIRANVAFYAIDARGPMPVGAALAPKGYIIGPEDVLQIQVTGQEGISGTYAVRPDGMVSVVLAGNIMAAGLTTSQLEAAISDRLDATGIISHPAVTVGVAAVHGPIKQNQ